MPSTEAKKYVAWGASPLFELYLEHSPSPVIDYCVDIAPEKQGTAFGDVTVHPPEKLFAEQGEGTVVVNFGHSSAALQSINRELSDRGFVLGENYLDFAAFAAEGFEKKLGDLLGTPPDPALLTYARAGNINSSTSLETTVLGNWLLLEMIRRSRGSRGAIAEIGAFKGGNAFLQLQAMTLWQDPRRYYVLDSFQGFDAMTPHDPLALQDAYNYDYHFGEIRNRFALFPQCRVIRGFVPGTFVHIPQEERFSLVFYDCDLYQPALDTYAFFWDRLEEGGMLVIHDNVATKAGWNGVAKATEEFFAPRGIAVHDFWESTMSVVLK